MPAKVVGLSDIKQELLSLEEKRSTALVVVEFRGEAGIRENEWEMADHKSWSAVSQSSSKHLHVAE